MDLQMPVMDGYTATMAIRQDERFKKLPIVAITAHVLVDERNRCYQAGMDDFVSKPIEPEALFATLRRWVPVRQVCESVSGGLVYTPPDIPGVESQKGVARLAGNVGLYRSLLLDLARQHRQTSADLAAAGSERDFNRIRHLAHTLKGVAGNLGLIAVYQKAAELEVLARQQAEPADCLSALLDALGKREP